MLLSVRCLVCSLVCYSIRNQLVSCNMIYPSTGLSIRAQLISSLYECLVIKTASCIYREKIYEDAGRGCYLLFFKFDGKRLCIDATEEDNTYGRLINHSKNSANLKMRVHPLEPREPRIRVAVDTAKRNIGGSAISANSFGTGGSL